MTTKQEPPVPAFDPATQKALEAVLIRFIRGFKTNPPVIAPKPADEDAA